MKILADLKDSGWCLLIWKVVILRTYEENFPTSLISGVKILADLKGLVEVDLKSCLSSTWTQDALCWLEDKRDICIFGEQENSFLSAD